MNGLDDLVTSHLVNRLFSTERLIQLFASLAARQAEHAAAVKDRIGSLQARADEADERLRRLYKVVEDGLAEMDDLLKDRIAALKADRETAYTALARARGTNRAPIVFAADKIAAFGELMREQLTSGTIPFRKAYTRAIIDRIEVDDQQIRICGRKVILEQAVLANGARRPGVRSFV